MKQTTTKFYADLDGYPSGHRIFHVTEGMDKRMREIAATTKGDTGNGKIALAYMKHIKKCPGARVELRTYQDGVLHVFKSQEDKMRDIKFSDGLLLESITLNNGARVTSDEGFKYNGHAKELSISMQSEAPWVRVVWSEEGCPDEYFNVATLQRVEPKEWPGPEGD